MTEGGREGEEIIRKETFMYEESLHLVMLMNKARTMRWEMCKNL
jgi:hypothetical protein